MKAGATTITKTKTTTATVYFPTNSCTTYRVGSSCPFEGAKVAHIYENAGLLEVTLENNKKLIFTGMPLQVEITITTEPFEMER